MRELKSRVDVAEGERRLLSEKLEREKAKIDFELAKREVTERFPQTFPHEIILFRRKDCSVNTTFCWQRRRRHVKVREE